MVRFDEVSALNKKIKCLLLTVLLTLAMCIPAFAEVITEYNGQDVSEVITYYQAAAVDNSLTMTEENIDSVIASYSENGYESFAEGYTQLKELLVEIQDAQLTGSHMETTDDEEAPLVIVYELKNDNGEFVCRLSLDESLSPAGIAYERAGGGSRDLGALMKNAVLNTVIGILVVFAVLILISFLISLFKYLPGSGAKQSKKAKPAAATAPVLAAPATPAAQDLTDDKELVAVITAAIAASMGTTSTDGFVVRSIKKRTWK